MSGITVLNRQRAVSVRLGALQSFAEAALLECRTIPSRGGNALPATSEINVVLVSDRRIAELHRRFLSEPGPTDVITFQHGEIVISAETARKQARAFRTKLEHELCLYIAHGLLHLRGFDDQTAAGAAEMKRVQGKLVTSLL